MIAGASTKISLLIATATLCAVTSCATNQNTTRHQKQETTRKSLPVTYPAWPPITRAIVFRQYTQALELISKGADLEARDQDGSTALWYAVERQSPNMEVVQALVEHGANVNARCIGGATPLHAAAQFAPPEVVRYLLDHGANPHAKDRFGWIPADYAKGSEQTKRDDVLRVLASTEPTTATSGGVQ